MKYIKHFFRFFIDPLKVVANRDVSEVVTKFFQKHVWAIYIMGLLLAVVIFYFVGGFDSLIELIKNS